MFYKDLRAFLADKPPLTIAVIGDVMLDQYVTGSVHRLAPEAPPQSFVPVLSDTQLVNKVGGAAFVASILGTCGVNAHMFGVIGADAHGEILSGLLTKAGVNIAGLVTDPTRPTTTKTRFQKNYDLLVRVDDETTAPIKTAEIDFMFDHLRSFENLSAIIISDYNKGVVTPELMDMVRDFARAQSVPFFVDPKGSDWKKYSGADLITPNVAELQKIAGNVNDDFVNTARNVMAQYDIQSVLLTRSENGMDFISKDIHEHQPSFAKTIVTVSGAGDHVMAGMAIHLTLNSDIKMSMIAASHLAAAFIEQRGETPQIPPATSNHPWDSARAKIAEWQRLGLKVGFTNGCFDILHAGHVMYLNQAKSHCDRLVLGLNSDASVRLLKGSTRPINHEQDRHDVMMGLKAIDHVVFFGAEKTGDDNTPSAVIERLKPDIFFKGGDYTIDQLPEAKSVLAYGGIVKILGLLDGRSTTNIIAKSASIQN